MTEIVKTMQELLDVAAKTMENIKNIEGTDLLEQTDRSVGIITDALADYLKNTSDLEDTSYHANSHSTFLKAEDALRHVVNYIEQHPELWEDRNVARVAATLRENDFIDRAMGELITPDLENGPTLTEASPPEPAEEKLSANPAPPPTNFKM